MTVAVKTVTESETSGKQWIDSMRSSFSKSIDKVPGNAVSLKLAQLLTFMLHNRNEQLVVHLVSAENKMALHL